MFRFGIHGLGLGRYCLPTKMSDSLSQGIADNIVLCICSPGSDEPLRSHIIFIIERAGVTGKYTQVSSAIFSVASSYCPLVRIHFVWTIFKAMLRPGENHPNETSP